MQATKGQAKESCCQERPSTAGYSGDDENPGSSIVEGSMLGTTAAKFIVEEGDRRRNSEIFKGNWKEKYEPFH